MDETKDIAVSPTRSVAMEVVTPGSKMLARLTDDQFDIVLGEMKKVQDRQRRIMRELMTENVHFGKVPGREKDPDAQFGLRKPGAEVLLKLYGYVADIRTTIEYGDPFNVDSPAIRVHVRCEVHAGTLEGPVVGVGVGAANTWETKYRYRQGQRLCPSCGKPALLKSKFAAKGGPFKGLNAWFCYAKRDGCGLEFAPDDERITTQVVGRVNNEDSQDLENTLLKIAAKRAKVDGAINSTNSSDIFTQDVEDMEAEEHAEPVKRDAAIDQAIQQVDAAKREETPTPTKPTPAGRPSKTDAERREEYLRRINEIVTKLHAFKSSRTFFAEHDGIECVIDVESLKFLRYKEPKPVDELSLEELERWGKWLTFQPGYMTPSPATAEMAD